jgi:hypothetical protein
MNDLGKQLSMFSFAVIGVIVLIGIIQKRSWLDMFTIGGKFNQPYFDMSNFNAISCFL